jgi:peptidoglycan glycosyltransferase
MVSRPTYDPNKVVAADSFDPGIRTQGLDYIASLNSSTPALINRPAQGLYAPGSSFKTVTLTAALDSGQYALNDARFSEDQAKSYTIAGHTFNWDDFGDFKSVATFPMDLEHGYAYSDNVIYGRVGVDLGADTWLHYVGLFGVETPGRDWNAVGFDAPAAQSRAYSNSSSNFDDVALAASAFGQGSLLISPLTMSVVASTIAADGMLRRPHVGLALTVYKGKLSGGTPLRDPSTDQQIMQPATAQTVRRAMWAVSDYGTASYGNAPDPIFGGKVNTSGTFMGGKTGTAQVGDGQRPDAWWISLAPDDQAPGAPGGAQYVVVVSKEGGIGSGNNEGACQVYVADDIYRYLLHIQ